MNPYQRADLEAHLAEVQRRIAAALYGDGPCTYLAHDLRERRWNWERLGIDPESKRARQQKNARKGP